MPAMPIDSTPPTAECVVVLTTLASEDAAVALVRALLDRRLVACGTVLPGARSLYRWEGQVADEREAVVLLKTTRARVHALEVAFRTLHPYAVPELLALPVAAGLARYVGWVAAEADGGGEQPAPARAQPRAGGASPPPPPRRTVARVRRRR
jgi:periplasmic divalent cation tolerance protein